MNETGTRDRMITSGSRGEEKGTASGKDPRPSEREDGRMGRMTAVWCHRVTRGSFVS